MKWEVMGMKYKDLMNALRLRNALQAKEIREEMGCNENLLELYFSGELKKEADLEFIEAHLEKCEVCKKEYEEKVEMRDFMIEEYRREYKEADIERKIEMRENRSEAGF